MNKEMPEYAQTTIGFAPYRSSLDDRLSSNLRKRCAFICACASRYLRHLLLSLLFVVCANPAFAADIVFGIGQDNVDSSDQSEAGALQFEYHTDPIRSYNWGSVSFMGVLSYDDDEDLFAGLGLSVLWDVAPKWFVETSLAAGYYDAGSEGLDLGGDFQFRTLLGFGYHLSETSRLSIAIDHLSNAGLEDVNPGRNGFFLRYARSF